MSKDSEDGTPRDAAFADADAALSTSDVPDDPLVTAASRGDDPLGMFAADSDTAVAAAPTVQEVQRPAIESPPVRPALRLEPMGVTGPPASTEQRDIGKAPTAGVGQKASQPSLSTEARAADLERAPARPISSEPRVPPGPPVTPEPRAPVEPPVSRELRAAADVRTSATPRQAGGPDFSSPPLARVESPVSADHRVAEPGGRPSAGSGRGEPAERRTPPPAVESRLQVRAATAPTEMDLPRPTPAGPFPGDRRTPPPSPSLLRIRLKSMPLVVAAIVVVGGVGFGAWRLVRSFASQPPAPPAAQEGRLTVESRPTGAQVELDGVVRGATPLGLRVKAGHHLLRVGGPSGREMDVVVAAGGDVSHHIELPEVRTRLHVATVPSAATVRVDGQARGAAPLDLDDLSPGTHTITVEAGGATVRRDVDVRAGADNSIVISLGGGGPTTGWLTVAAPFDVEVYEGSRLVGRSRDGQMLLVSGPHDLTLTNADLGYKEASRVTVAAGTTATLRVQPRNGQLSVNAIPWAEVFLDGNRIGETPIANYAVPIGQHEVLLRHPQLGEQRRTVVVALTSPTRIGVTFSK